MSIKINNTVTSVGIQADQHLLGKDIYGVPIPINSPGWNLYDSIPNPSPVINNGNNANALGGINTPAHVYIPIEDPGQVYPEITTHPLWSNNQPRLLTPSINNSGDLTVYDYMLNVYNTPENSNTCRDIQYKIIYGDYEGRGGKDLGGNDNETLTKAMYTQYVNILLPQSQKKFNFNGEDEDYVYIIDIQRDRFKQLLDPGNWQLTISHCNFSSDINVHSILTNLMTASMQDTILTLVDTTTNTDHNNELLHYSTAPLDIVIGTIEDGVGNTYVSSSLTSGSNAPNYDEYVSEGDNTSIILGAQARFWEFENISGSVEYEVIGDIYPGQIYRQLRGTFTASFNNGTASFFEGGTWGEGDTHVLDTFSGTLMGTSEGQLNLNTGEIHCSNLVNESYTYTTESIDYTGVFKGLFFNSNKPGIQAAQDGSLSVITRNGNTLTGTFSGPGIGKFYYDAWGSNTHISNDPDDIKIFPDGNLLFPITPTVFGKMYPSHGIIVLSGKKLDELGFNTNRSIDRHGYNTYRLYHSMQLVLNNELTDLSGDLLGFYGRGIDVTYNKLYFIRHKNRELNFSNNPTYISGSEGDITEPFLYENKVYFTSIGLYNPRGELLGIAKLPKVLKSSLINESIFRVNVKL